MFNSATLVTLGFALIFTGFIIIFLASLSMFFKEYRVRGKTKGGGLVMIGPIPIVFGTDRKTVKILLLLSVILMILAIVLMLLPSLIL